MEIWYKDIAYRPVAEILPRGLVHKSRQKSLSREPVQWFHKETLCRDIGQRYVEILPRSPPQRSCQEPSDGDLVQTHCKKTCCRDLATSSTT